MSAHLYLEQMLRRALHERVTPGLAFGVAQGDAIRFTFHGGRLSHLSDDAAVGPETVFDLASLTKPITTVTWALRLIEAGRLSLGDAIGDHVEVADLVLAREPVSRLLTHTSGLPAHREYFRGLLPHVRASGGFETARTTIGRMVRGTRLEGAPGEREVYSDLGFLLLERICEAVDAPLAQIWPTLPLHGPGALRFRPLPAAVRPELPSGRYAATEVCALRGGLVRGEVHDENAWTCGGVCGHAGLFGRLSDVLAFGQAVVAGWQRGEGPLGIGQALWRHVNASQWINRTGTRVIGWDTPSPGQSSAGRHFGSQTIGHLGFTGTSLWIDLEAGVVMVLLTNRVCPTRENIAIRALRPAVHDAAWGLFDPPQESR